MLAIENNCKGNRQLPHTGIGPEGAQQHHSKISRQQQCLYILSLNNFGMSAMRATSRREKSDFNVDFRHATLLP